MDKGSGTKSERKIFSVGVCLGIDHVDIHSLGLIRQASAVKVHFTRLALTMK